MIDNTGRKLFVVDITEQYHKTIIVPADTTAEAEKQAEALCNCGAIDLSVDHHFVGRTTSAYEATESDLDFYQLYEGDDYQWLVDKDEEIEEPSAEAIDPSITGGKPIPQYILMTSYRSEVPFFESFVTYEAAWRRMISEMKMCGCEETFPAVHEVTEAYPCIDTDDFGLGKWGGWYRSGSNQTEQTEWYIAAIPEPSDAAG